MASIEDDEKNILISTDNADDYDSEEDEDYVGGNDDSDDGGSNSDSDDSDEDGWGKKKNRKRKTKSSSHSSVINNNSPSTDGNGKAMKGTRKRGRTVDLEAIDAEEIKALREEVIEAYGEDILKDDGVKGTGTDTTTTTGRQGYLNTVYDTLIKEVQEQYTLYANGKPSRFNELVTYFQEQYQKSQPSSTTPPTSTTSSSSSSSITGPTVSTTVHNHSSSLPSLSSASSLPSNIYAIGTTAGPGGISNGTKRSKDSVSFSIPHHHQPNTEVLDLLHTILRTPTGIRSTSVSSSSTSSSVSTDNAVPVPTHQLLHKLLYLLTNSSLSNDGCISGIHINASTAPVPSYLANSTVHNTSYLNTVYNGGVNIVAVPPQLPRKGNKGSLQNSSTVLSSSLIATTKENTTKKKNSSTSNSSIPGLAYLQRLTESTPTNLTSLTKNIASHSIPLLPIAEYTIEEQNQIIIPPVTNTTIASSVGVPPLDKTIRQTALKTIAAEALARTQNKKMAITRTVKFAGKTQTITEYVDPGSQAARTAMEAAANASIRNTLATMDTIAVPSTNTVGRSSGTTTTTGTSLANTKLPPVTGTLTLNAVIDNLDKPESISTLAKTNIDWEQYKIKEGLDETFENKAAQAGFVEKQAFLSRVDERQDETDRKQRAIERRARDLANMGNNNARDF